MMGKTKIRPREENSLNEIQSLLAFAKQGLIFLISDLPKSCIINKN